MGYDNKGLSNLYHFIVRNNISIPCPRALFHVPHCAQLNRTIFYKLNASYKQCFGSGFIESASGSSNLG
jgi:hypothetical protein